MGNRGILHDAHQRLGRKRWQHKAWVTCLLSFKNRERKVMTPGHYTELFFFDEAVAFAAGHRPCAECRRADFNRFCACLGLGPPISDYDAQLHAARAIPRRFEQRRWQAVIDDLPEGTFVLKDDVACLVLGDAVLPYTTDGYARPWSRPRGERVTVLTPAPLVDALRAGYSLDIARP